MTNIEKLALSKLVSGADASKIREKVKPGEYEVDLNVHVCGTITVGEDYFRAPTASIPLKETMALLLHRMGVTREAAKAILIDVLSAAILEKGKGEGSIYEFYKEEIEAAQEHVKEIISVLPPTSCKGPVNADLELSEVIENPPEAMSA